MPFSAESRAARAPDKVRATMMLCVLTLLVSGCTASAPPGTTTAADVALYEGSDRLQRLTDGAKREGGRRPDLWADRVQELLGDAGLREELHRRGSERAGMFDWRRAAAETAVAFHTAGRLHP